MKFLTDVEVAELLDWGSLIDAIAEVMVDPAATAPMRTLHAVPVEGAADGALLMKPGWITGEVIGVKVVTVYPDNGTLDLPTVQSGFLLFDAHNGSMLGACEANELTARRTAAASALAAKYLARPDARRLLVVGTGAVGSLAALAHGAVRDYELVEVWGRRPEPATAVVETLVKAGVNARVCDDLDAGVAEADVISCSTGATEPLVHGRSLTAGTHVDLIGSFNATMRESDDDVIERSAVFVDTRDDAVLAGDLAQPIAAGRFAPTDIEADLAELVSGSHAGRTDQNQITVFKSVGTSLEDLAAARLAFG